MSTHKIEIQENDHGEPCIIFPPELLNALKWSEGDTLRFKEHGDGIMIRKINLKSVELDFTDEELYKYMQMAHEKGQSLDEFIEDAITGVIEEVKEFQDVQNLCDRPVGSEKGTSTDDLLEDTITR